MNDLIVCENNVAVIDYVTASKMVDIERELKRLNKAYDDYKTRIAEEMSRKGIKKVDAEVCHKTLSITYYPESEKERFDSKKFRTENPDLYDEYVVLSPVKEFVKIAVKDKADE